MGVTQNILVPTDFSKSSELALGAARMLAEQNDARVTLVHVLAIEPLAVGQVQQDMERNRELEAAVHGHLDAVREEHFGGLADVKTVLVRAGHTAIAICELAEEQGVDMIVMATHGRTGLARLLIGSVAEAVIRHAPCPVLLLRSKARESRFPTIEKLSRPPPAPSA